MNRVSKIWILPFISGIVAIIALLAPAVILNISNEYGSYTELQWLWGLVYYDLENTFFDIYETGFQFIFHIPVLFALSVITLIVILAGSILSIVSSSMLRKDSQRFTSIKKYWIISGILLIGTGIIWAIAMQLGFLIYKMNTLGEIMNFWETRLPNIGLIGPIVCGVLPIIGVIIGTKSLKKRDIIISPADIEMSRLEEKTYPAPQLVQNVDSTYLNFCPECGFKIHYKDKNFCTNCGFSLNFK